MSVSSKMIVPKKITVGYRTRPDTYTGKLAYVIYTDAKGVLRKEKSWQDWRDKKIESTEFDNAPFSGFVLNRKAGGGSRGWDARQTYVRVYDPRDFEFEIQIPNLLFILQETSAIKGKGLEGEFVYAWSGTELVLLPTCSAEYQECVKYTDYQVKKVGKSEMLEGHSYLMKDMTEVMYLGKHLYGPKNWRQEYLPIGPRHVFVKLEKSKYGPSYIPQTGFTKIAAKISDGVLPEFADEYDAFKKSKSCFSEAVEVKIVKKNLKKIDELSYYGEVTLIKEDEKYYAARIQKTYDNNHYSQNRVTKYEIVKGEEFTPTLKNGFCYIKEPPYSYHNSYNSRFATQTISAEELSSREFYSAVVTTKNGLQIDLIKQNY